MVKGKKNPMELVDDVYSLAYWMTGSTEKAEELVSRTYRNAATDSSETELFKMFRASYFDIFEADNAFSLPAESFKTKDSSKAMLLHEDADIRLSVLLSAISGLKHQAISTIIGKPLLTIRVWLSQGRKSLVNGTLLRQPLEWRYEIWGEVS